MSLQTTMHWSWPRQHSDCHDLWQSATTQAVQKLSLLNAAAQSAPTVTSGTKHTKIKSTALEGRKEGRKERKGERTATLSSLYCYAWQSVLRVDVCGVWRRGDGGGGIVTIEGYQLREGEG